MSQNDDLIRRMYAFSRRNTGTSCALCGRPAGIAGAFIATDKMKASLQISPIMEAVYFYMACEDCLHDRLEELQRTVERRAMEDTGGLSVEQN
jgi:hypothetical protein